MDTRKNPDLGDGSSLAWSFFIVILIMVILYSLCKEGTVPTSTVVEKVPIKISTVRNNPIVHRRLPDDDDDDDDDDW